MYLPFRGQEGQEDLVTCMATIHGLGHDLVQLLKSSERKMVMYNIASNLNGIFRRIGKATE